MTQDLLSQLRVHAAAHQLFPQGGRALLAVSGGPDSVAMVDLMTTLAPEFALELVVGHVDHGITSESHEVASGVAQLAASYGLSCHHVTLRLGPDASETLARRARYRALRQMQRDAGARYLLTAHHADDQVETVLFRVLRGSGTAGLAGIPAQGPRGLVRPLLPFTKAQLREWIANRSGEHRELETVHEDPANESYRHDRSWLRTQIMPLLRARFGSLVDDRVLGLAEHAARERDAWELLLRELPELDLRLERGAVTVARSSLGRYDKLLSEALLRALAREAGCVLGPRRAARVRQFVTTAPSGRRLQLGKRWEVEVAFDRVRFKRADRRSESTAPAAWGGETSGQVEWAGWRISWHAATAAETTRTSFATWMTVGPGVVRGPEPGDRLVPLGGVGRRKVRRLLMEARVPSQERGDYPVFVRGGSVLWIPGVCRSNVALPAEGAEALKVEAHAVRND